MPCRWLTGPEISPASLLLGFMIQCCVSTPQEEAEAAPEVTQSLKVKEEVASLAVKVKVHFSRGAARGLEPCQGPALGVPQ